ncbi:YegP family protein [Porifericola rhodea]|uniref:YegP family protein n=1 Tax=Porifericola rhodea TaxID=930972 RepID=UPI0026670B88|nr:YegP family protein [Porifericola rhodea]WKN30274.1 YegP family protein [Porifericola rhodea]
MGKFIISKRKNGEFQFTLKASNGQAILSSEGYKTKTNCLKGIASVQKNALNEKRFEKKTSSNGKHYFNLKASNGQVIGSSQMYASEGSCDKGIDSVQTNAPQAVTDDQSAAVPA